MLGLISLKHQSVDSHNYGIVDGYVKCLDLAFI